MTSHRDSHTITDVKLEIIPGVQTGNGIPHDKYNICGIAHTHTNRKDDIFMQRRMYIDEAHTAQDIFCFAVFLLLLLLSLQSTHVPDLHELKHIGRPLSGLLLTQQYLAHNKRLILNASIILSGITRESPPKSDPSPLYQNPYGFP